MTRVLVVQKGWKEDEQVENGDDAEHAIGVMVWIDGHYVEGAVAVTPVMRNDFTSMTIEVIGAIKVKVVGKGDWDSYVEASKKTDADADDH